MATTQSKKIRQSTTTQSGKPLRRRLGLLGVAALAGILYQTLHHRWQPKVMEKVQPNTPQTQAPVFEFYTQLPKGSDRLWQPVHKDKPQAKVAPTIINPRVNTAQINKRQQLTPSNSHQATRKLAATPSKTQPLPLPTMQKHFLLQVAAFKQRKDADSLRAELLLQGFNAHITTFSSQQNTVWYRVQIGPIASVAEAKQMQLRLEGESLQGLIKEIT